MNAQTFLDEFSTIANAPGGVQRLREMILQLAVQGRLVEQDPNDESADDFLSKLKERKDRLIQEGQIKRVKALPALPSDLPVLPNGWAYSRLGDLMTRIGSGATPRGGKNAYVKEGIPFLRSQNIWNNGVRLDDVAYIPDEIHSKMSNTHVKPNDLLLNITGASLGRCAVCPDSLTAANVSQHVSILRSIDPRLVVFLHMLLLSPLVQKMIWGRQVGMAREGLSKKVLELFEIPVPPISEQSRIVAKVDELMGLSDRLEEQQSERSTLIGQARKASLKKLADAPAGKRLQKAWRRVEANLSQLFETPEDVDDLKQCILQNAVMGKLVPQDQNNESRLNEIIEKTKTVKEEYRQRKWLRKKKPVLMTEGPQSAFPSNWKVTCFDHVAIIIGGITKGRNLTNRKTQSYPYLRVANVQRGFFLLDLIKEISVPEDEFSKYEVHDGDLMITEGGDWDKVGRTAVWRNEIPNCLHQNHVFKARVVSDQLSENWCMLVLNSTMGREYFAGASKQTTNLASINMTQLRGFPIPVPPLREQMQIVSAFQKLVDQCNDLKKKLTEQIHLSTAFGQSVVEYLTGISTEKQEKMKAPNEGGALNPILADAETTHYAHTLASRCQVSRSE